MAMLAWLMRGGWVTQLCTFAYVVVWPEIIYEVEYQLEAEEIERAKKAQSVPREPSSTSTSAGSVVAVPVAAVSAASASAAVGSSSGIIESDDAAATAAVAALGDAAVAGFGSGFLTLTDDNTPDSTSFCDLPFTHAQSKSIALNRPILHHSQACSIPPGTPSFPPSTQQPHHLSISVATPSPHFLQPTPHTPTTATCPPQTVPVTTTPTPYEQAAEKARLERIADKAARELAERALAHSRKPVPQVTPHPSVNHAKHLEGIQPHIILDAKRATGKESLYLSAIERRFKLKAEEKRRQRGEKGSALGTGAESGSGSGTGSSSGSGKPQHHYHGHQSSRVKDATTTTTATTTNLMLHPNSNATASNQASSRITPKYRDSTADLDERVADAWPAFCKYFNGRSALERIALQEDMKRKDVWTLLTAMSEYLLCVRHW